MRGGDAMRTVRGQAAVELVFSMGIFLLLLLFLVELGRLGLTQQKALSLAVFGNALQGCHLLASEDIGRQLGEFANDLNPSHRINFQIETGRFYDVPGANFYQLVKTQINFATAHFSGREIMVEQKAPMEE
jgi:hypothetical protein